MANENITNFKLSWYHYTVIICKHDALTSIFQISKLFPSLLLILPSVLGFQLYSVQMCLLFTFKTNTDIFYSHLPHSGCRLSGVLEQFILCLLLLKRKMNLNTLHVMLWESTFSSCHFYPLSSAPLTSNALKISPTPSYSVLSHFPYPQPQDFNMWITLASCPATGKIQGKTAGSLIRFPWAR